MTERIETTQAIARFAAAVERSDFSAAERWATIAFAIATGKVTVPPDEEAEA